MRDEKRAWIIFALAAVFAIIAAPILYVTASNLAAKLAGENFYRAHPILNSMRAVHHHQGVDWDARNVLLQHLPLGTSSATVFSVLAAEAFTCITYAGSNDAIRRASGLDHVDAKGTLATCGANPPTQLGQMEWIVSLSFGEDGRLLDAAVRGDWLFL
jgi:hypothetical protein